MVDPAKAQAATPLPGRIAQRYRVIKALGQGGMARVYQVFDEHSGRELALKHFLPGNDSERSTLLALFEAEFNLLAQLSHPRVIEVYDYGHSEQGPFYTMELLDGGDLSDRSPMPWREACALVCDVGSSLALLHSRRFVHRDVTPRNVRCTRDGRAKLIDFGTMVPMGHSSVIAGTPAFVAPEIVNRSALDGRADLFSLGATLYYALTKRPAFPAREFSELASAWSRKPRPPSSFDPQIPAALDALVLGLLSIDPATRPRSAFEVIQRLSAIAGLEREESLVSQAYLSTPTLVGRERVLADLGRRLEHAKSARGSACMLRAESGLGCSRVLDACALDAKADGAIVLRAQAAGSAGESFAVAQALAEQLLDALGASALGSARAADSDAILFQAVPDLIATGVARDSGSRARLNRFCESKALAINVVDALQRWFSRVSERQLVVIAVDDVQRCDEQSASFLAALAARLKRRRMLLLLSAESAASEHASDAAAVLAEHCESVDLQPLTREQTEGLLSSVFGTVPNLGVLTEAIHEVARGNPGECMATLQHLVDRGVLRYAAGSWTLPAQIDPALLPRSAEDAMRERIAGLDPLARFLAEAHALASFDSCSRAEYIALRPDADHQSIDRALLALLSQQILICDGAHYVFARRRWASMLSAALDDPQRKERHRALARAYEPRSQFAVARHLLAAGERERGLALVYAFVEDANQDATTIWERSGGMRPADLAGTVESAHRAAVELGRPRRERIVTAGWLVGLSLISDDSYYFRFVDEWRSQLEHDSGYTIYCELVEIGDPGQRLMQALTRLSERFAATPEAQRAYAPEEAIKLLVLYVGVSIAIGSRTYNRQLLASLPALLEPFVALSPAIDAVRLNALASCDMGGDCRMDRARARWLEVYAKLSDASVAELPAISAFRAAIAYAIGLVEARIGLVSAANWVELLDRDPTQRVNAFYLRKVMSLHHGDFEGAERWRKQAEIVALQTPMRQMFTQVVIAELGAHAAADDLVGVKQALERIAPLSARHPGWAAFGLLADAQFQFIRGDVEAAIPAFERCLALCTPDPRAPEHTIAAWPSCVGSYIEALQRLDRYPQARKVAQDALALCDQLELGTSSHPIARGLALSEARLGDHEAAWARLEALVAIETKLGIQGLQLGATYEACTRIAIWTGAQERLQHYARLTATEYRYGHGSPLGARYERLMDEARHAGVGALPELADFASTAMTTTGHTETDASMTRVLETMIGASDRKQRAERSLRMLCEARGAVAGYLYLCAARGIALAAAIGGEQPPTGLRDFLEQQMRNEQEDIEIATAIATGPELESAPEASSWIDPIGSEYQALVLTGMIDGEIRQIGVMSFVVASKQRHAVDVQLNAAIAAYLIGAGDVHVTIDPSVRNH